VRHGKAAVATNGTACSRKLGGFRKVQHDPDVDGFSVLCILRNFDSNGRVRVDHPRPEATADENPRKPRVTRLYCAGTKISPSKRVIIAPVVSQWALRRLRPFAMSEQETDVTRSLQLLSGIGFLSDTQLKALLSQAPVGAPQTPAQYHQLVIANAARAEVMRRALRTGW